MNTVNQFLNWFVAPASHSQAGGWLTWFDTLSRGWGTRDARPQALDPTNGQVLVALLDRLVTK